MKKTGFCFIFFCCMTSLSIGQVSNEEIIQLKRNLNSAQHDSTRLTLYYQLANGYRFSNIDSSLFYSDQAIGLADKLKLLFVKSQMLSLKGATVLESGKLPESLQYQFEALQIGEKINDKSTIAYALNRIGNIYMELANYKKANEYYTLSQEQFQLIKDTGMVHNEVSNIGNVYELMGMPDSALFYQQIVYDASLKTNDRKNYTRPEIMFRMGNAYNLNGDQQKALAFYKRGVIEAKIDNDLRNLSMNNLFIAKLYYKMNLPDSSMKYALNTIQTSKNISFRKGIYEASVLISEIFKGKKDFESAYEYLSLANIERDSLAGTKRFQDLQRIILDEQNAKKCRCKKSSISKPDQTNCFNSRLGNFFIYRFHSLP